jgi:hypothetical protein
MNETAGRQAKSGDDSLDFKAIKEGADIRKVLSHFGVFKHLEARGSELVGWCPFGEEHGKKDSFSMNVEKQKFQCFACKEKGSILDFVMALKKCDLRDAARTVLSIMEGGEKEEQKSGGRPYGKSRPENTPQKGVPDIPGAVAEAGEDVPPVMSFSLASRLIIANKIKPEHLLVVDMDAVGIEWKKAKRE